MKQQIKDVLMDDFWIMPATPEYVEEGIPYITSKNIKNGMIDFSKVNYISQEAYEGISKNRPILVGDILISMIGTLGEAAEIAESDGLFYGQNMFLVRLDESKINKRYFLNFLKSNYVKRELDRKQNQSTQKYLKANHIEDLTIPVPTLEEQYVIAWQLDKLAAIIALRKTEDRLLDEIIKARFIELFGNPEINDRHWDEHKLSDELNVIGGYAFKSDSFQEDGIPVLRIGNINAGTFRPVNLVYWKKDDDLSRYLMYPGDLVMSLTGTVGKDDYGNVCILGPEYEKYYLNQRNAKLELKDGLDKYYLAELLKFPQVKKRLTGISRGVRQANISNKDILDLLVPIPPLQLQQQFAVFVAQVDKSKAAVQKALDETQLLFDSLMQEYFG